MSIANDYLSTADWVAGYAMRQETISPHAARHLAQVLMDLADRAKRLERAEIVIAALETVDD